MRIKVGTKPTFVFKIKNEMKKKYFEILSSLGNKSQESLNVNSKVLIVDGTNLFIRAHAASPVVSEYGYHKGGVTGSLNSLGYAIKNINPTRVVVVFDGKGGSQRRRKIYSEYKAGRKTHTNVINTKFYNTKDEEKQSMILQINDLVEYLEALPLQCISIDLIEADDTIAYLTKYFTEQHKSKCYIMSTDKDFLQLVNDDVTVWSPTKKKFYTREAVMEEYEGIAPENLIMYRIMGGDKSDNISGIKGAGLKSIKKKIPFLFENSNKICILDIINYIEDKQNDAVIYKSIYENKEKLELNYRLMQLSDVDISGHSKEKILNIINQPIPRLAKHKFILKLVNDGLNTLSVFKAPDLWLKTHFFKLDMFAAEQK